jgi:hypothetical protein
MAMVGGWTSGVLPVRVVLGPVEIWNDAGPDRVPSQAEPWVVAPGAHHEWILPGVLLRASLSSPAGPEGWYRLGLMASVRSPVAIKVCAIDVVLPSVEAPLVVDRAVRWRTLRRSTAVGELTPLAARSCGPNNDGVELRAERGGAAAELSWSRRELRVRVYLDAAALHPRWSFQDGVPVSTAAPLRRPGDSFAVSLLLRRAAQPGEPPVIAARFPAGHEAAFVLTDHPDFDTVERLALFLKGERGRAGWSGRGLRLTKGVFAIPSDPAPARPAPTLADAEYRRLIASLHDDGSEIAPHGVNEWGNVSPDAFRRALEEVARTYAPRTWIDHGTTLAYCYTMGGAIDPAYDLLRELERHGFTALWAYHDVPAVVPSLDMLSADGLGLRAAAFRSVQHLAQGHVLVPMHYLRSVLRLGLPGTVGLTVAVGLSAARAVYMAARKAQPVGESLRRARGGVATALAALRRNRVRTAAPYSRDEVRALGPVLYPERGVPLREGRAGDLYLFATVEVLHVRDEYTPGALAELVRRRGLHIAHCYLLNELPYIAGIFSSRDGARPSLAREWLDFLDALTAGVAAQSVWNPTMGELTEWLTAAQRIALYPDGPGRVLLAHDLERPVRDVTLLLPPDVAPDSVLWGDGAPRGWRRWHDWLAVWGDVPARRTTAVRWGRGLAA